MGSTSPERPQPVWCPGPFILGRDWTRASRGVGLQQFCRAQISLSAQSEPLAGRDICCLTFLIYTSPPSHTNIWRCSPPFQTSPSPSITERTVGGGGGDKAWEHARRARGSATCSVEFGKLCRRDSQQLVWSVYLHHPFNVFRVRERRKAGKLYIIFSSFHLCLPAYVTHHPNMLMCLISYVF